MTAARRVGVTTAVVFALVIAGGCGNGNDDETATARKSSTRPTNAPSTTPATAPTTTIAPPPPVASLHTVSIALQPVNGDIKKATAMAWKDGDPAAYVVTQTGSVYRLDNGVATVVLDLSGEVPPYQPGSEQGLLGIAFDPRNGRMVLHFDDRNGDTHVVSYAMTNATVDPASRWDILQQEQPGLGHKGGQLAFDRDGNLYIALGDGGGSKGRDAQDMSKLLGAILRITPKLDGPGYDIPPGNPFAGQANVRPELWAKGLRNPWRFSIDAPTGDLWIGDVGEEDIEEIDVMHANQTGANFGWYYYEGTHQRSDDAPPGLTPPVYEYPHETGIAVQGGFVYRGAAVPALAGAYVFGDVNGTMWAMGSDGVVALPTHVAGTLSGFAQGPDNELYAQSLAHGIFKIVPGP
jgi:glucose/arabinose dehydrogenase